MFRNLTLPLFYCLMFQRFMFYFSYLYARLCDMYSLNKIKLLLVSAHFYSRMQKKKQC